MFDLLMRGTVSNEEEFEDDELEPVKIGRTSWAAQKERLITRAREDYKKYLEERKAG